MKAAFGARPAPFAALLPADFDAPFAAPLAAVFADDLPADFALDFAAAFLAGAAFLAEDLPADFFEVAISCLSREGVDGSRPPRKRLGIAGQSKPAREGRNRGTAPLAARIRP